VQQEQDLAAKLAQLKVRAGNVGEELVTLRQLEREAAAKRTIYEDFLIYAKGAGERRNLISVNVSVISPAYVPLDPIGPSRSVIAAGFMMLGFLGGVGLGMGRGILGSIRDRAASRRRLRRPPFAAVTAHLVNPSEGPAAVSGAEETSPTDSQTGDPNPQEAAMNPLTRLIQSIRWPSRNGSSAANAEASSIAATRRETLAAEDETPGRDGSSNQEAFPMYPYPQQQQPYPQQQQSMQPHPAYPHQPVAQPAPYAQPYQPPFAPPQYPPHFAQQPVVYPYPQAMPVQPAFHGWPQQPVAVSPYGYQAPVAAPYPPYAGQPQPAFYPQEQRPAPVAESRPVPPPREMSPIEEVRESLREFRDAIRDLAEDRRKRYS
jgi:hypothetical protein